MGYQTNRHEIPNQMVLFTDHLLVFFNIRHIPLLGERALNDNIVSLEKENTKEGAKSWEQKCKKN